MIANGPAVPAPAETDRALPSEAAKAELVQRSGAHDGLPKPRRRSTAIYPTHGRAEEAIERHRAALDLARETGDRLDHALALAGLARALHDADLPAQTDRYRREARVISADLGIPALPPA